MSYTFLQEQGEESSAASFSGIPAYVLLRLNLTAAKCCSNDSETGCSQDSRSGTTCEPSTASPGADTLTSSPAVFHAKTSASQGRAKASTVSGAGSGWRWPESSMKYDRDSHSWRTRQRSLLGGLAEFSETWPKWGSMRDGECSALTMQDLHTSEIESGFWQTPVADDSVERAKGKFNSRGEPKLSAQVKLWPTPVADRDRAVNYAQGGTSLGFAARNFPTPTACQSKGTSPASLTRKDGRSRKNDRLDHRVLADAIESAGMFPTPTVSGNHNRKGMSKNSGDGLSTFVKRLPTPQARDFRIGQRKRIDDPKRQNNLNDAIGGALNPPWVAWLMGWPIGWTDSKPLATDKYQQWQRSHGAYSEDQ